jgi:circadian clock protein KaiA
MPEPALIVASLIRDPRLQQACSRWLVGGRCRMVWVDPTSNPLVELEQRREEFDAVLLEQGALSPEDCRAFVDLGLLMPAVVIVGVGGQIELHEAEVHLPPDQLEQLSYSLDAAVSRYLREGLAGSESSPAGQSNETPDRWKLANRLKGRVGFVGVFYKRDPAQFLRNLSQHEREELIHSLERTYRDLLLSYFRDPAAANQALESFVNTAFFSDLPITKTVEIHMNLIDGFSKQHLCEMYRRSIPADAPLTGLPVQASGQPTMA